MKIGDVVICGSGQAGTLTDITGDSVIVQLRCGEIWYGPKSQCRLPQSPEDLEAAPIEVPRIAPKRKRSQE